MGICQQTPMPARFAPTRFSVNAAVQKIIMVFDHRSPDRAIVFAYVNLSSLLLTGERRTSAATNGLVSSSHIFAGYP